MSLDWHLQCSPPPVQTSSPWCHSAGRASLLPSVLLGSCRRKRLLQHLHPSCRTEGLRQQCPATWIKAMPRLLCMFMMGVFCLNVVSLFVKRFPTHHRRGQPRPRRIRKRTPVPAHKRCARPRAWKRCRSLSLAGPQLHCDWLWGHQPPRSGPNCWGLCAPCPGRILGCDIMAWIKTLLHSHHRSPINIY